MSDDRLSDDRLSDDRLSDDRLSDDRLSDDRVSDSELFYRLSEDKLRRRATWGGAALSLSLLMPYEIIDDQPQFLWQLFGELPVSGIVAALAMVVAGIVIVLARYLIAPAVPFAMAVVAAMFGAFICHRIGSDASSWGLLPLPQNFAARATLALVAMAATAAGTSIAHQKQVRGASRTLIYGGIVVALFFYAWPGRGRAPAMMIVDQLTVVAHQPGLQHQLGAVTVGVVALWPAMITVAGLLYVRRPPATAMTALPMVSLFGFPLLLMMLLFAWYARENPGSALYAAMGAAFEITAVLALLSGAFEVVLTDRTTRSRVAPLVCSTALVALTVGMWLLAAPPDKGVQWRIGEASDAGDQLFGEHIPRWSRARADWRRRVERDIGAAEAQIRMRERGRALIDAAEVLDASLADKLTDMVAIGERIDASSRGWYRAVGLVNAASRDAALPYYLDPEVRLRKRPSGLRRQFHANGFRVVRARRFDVEGDTFSALHVQRLRGEGRQRHRVGLLGMSRDVQAFALVVVEANAAHLEDLERMVVDRDPPRCGRAFRPGVDAIFERCGVQLREMVERHDLGAAVTAKVERHELQHQIDGPLLPLATPVMKKLAAYATSSQARVNRELSAYLAQLTSSVSPIHVGLVIPLRFALLETRGTYHHASVLMFEALGDRRIRGAFGRVDPSLLAPVFDELSRLSEEALRARAAAAWKRLFGSHLPAVRLLL